MTRPWPSTRRQSASQRIASQIFLLLLFLMMVFMFVPVHGIVPLEVALMFQGLKPIILLTFFVGILALHATAGFVIPKNVTVWAGLFVLWYLMVSLIWKADQTLTPVFIALLWLFLNAIVSRFWLRSIPYTIAARGLVIGMAIALLFGGIVFALYGREFDTFSNAVQNRIAFGFENPNFFAQIPVVMVFAFALLQAESGRKNWRLPILALGVVAFIVAVLAVSRSSFLALLVFFAYLFLPQKRSRYTVFFVLAILILPMLAFISYERLNSVGSGRLAVWAFVIESAFAESGWSIFLGAQTTPALDHVLHSYSRLSDAEATSNAYFRADNVFLQLLIDGGLVLLGLYLVLLRALFKFSGDLPLRLRTVWRAAFSAILVQSFTISNQFAFFGPMSFFAFIFIMLPLHYRAPVMRYSVEWRSPQTSA